MHQRDLLVSGSPAHATERTPEGKSDGCDVRHSPIGQKEAGGGEPVAYRGFYSVTGKSPAVDSLRDAGAGGRSPTQREAEREKRDGLRGIPL